MHETVARMVVVAVMLLAHARPPVIALPLAVFARIDSTRLTTAPLEGPGRGAQNFFQVDLRTAERRQLTNLKGGFAIQNFDGSPDGKHIVFDRVADNSI